MIRLTTPDDIAEVIALADATGLFEPEQTESLAQMMHQHFSGKTETKDLWLTYDNGKPVGIGRI